MLKRFRYLEFRFRAARRFKNFEQGARQPEVAFEKLWAETFRHLSRGEFWKQRGLQAKLENNPTTDYEDYRIPLENSFASRTSPLNGESILTWAVSSGSSGPPKKFPITHTYKNQVHDFHVQFFYNYLRRFPKFLKQPVFYLAAHGPMSVMPSGIPVSYISNYNFRNMPRMIQNFYGTPKEILRDEETSFKWRPLYVLALDASAFMSATPSVIVALLKQIEARGPELYDYLSGETALPKDLPPLKVSAARLQELVAAGVRNGKIDFAMVWPGMAFAGCWTSAVCKLQAIELRQMLGPKIPVVEMPFSATEAWATMPLSDDRATAAIHAATLLVEFGPVGVKNPKHLLKPWQLKEGQEYELYITNLMGLVRYRMYDIVRCTGHYQNVAEISFVRKSSQEISLGLGCISETELIQALEPVLALRGKRVFFSPNQNGQGLTLFVESKDTIAPEVADQVFQELCRLNPTYQRDVEEGTLARIDAHAIDPGHRIWRLSHSQSKPYLIHHSRPELE